MKCNLVLFKRILLTTLLLVSASLSVSITTAQASSKALPSIPQKLQGYWYAYDTVDKGKRNIDKIYMHITSKEVETSAIGEKTVKQGLYTFLSLHLDGIFVIKPKQEINHKRYVFGTKRKATFNQVGHNRWNMYSVYAKKGMKTGYVTNRFALTGRQGHYKFFVKDWVYSEKPNGFIKTPLAAHEVRKGNRPVFKYTKISNKYLRSIGIYN